MDFNIFSLFYLTLHFIAFPSMPTYNGNVDSYIEAFLVFIGQVIAYPFEALIYAIGSGLGTGISNLFTSLFGLAATTYNNSVNSFKFAGPLAPILVSVVWGISLVIVIFFILMAIHLIWGDIQDDTGD